MIVYVSSFYMCKTMMGKFESLSDFCCVAASQRAEGQWEGYGMMPNYKNISEV